MKTILSSLLFAATAMVVIPAFAADTYTIDPNHSFQKFSYHHLGFSHPEGRFDKTSGSITLDMARHSGSADVSIAVNSVSTGVPALDEHLQGADFFDAAKYPTITFKSHDFKFDGDKLVAVTGDLSIHGVTRPVTLDVTNFACHPHPMTKKPACGVDASATIKRSEFGVGAYVPAVSDEVKLTLEVEAMQQ
ncbi:MAG: YceI family protein [Stenotrophobium sp.]